MELFWGELVKLDECRGESFDDGEGLPDEVPGGDVFEAVKDDPFVNAGVPATFFRWKYSPP
jgi:hypothetical protein